MSKISRKRCPLWYDDGCPYLLEGGDCDLEAPEQDCDDYAAYHPDEDEEEGEH